MASACVNNHAADHAFGWVSPRISFSRDPEPSPGHKLQPEADLLPGEDSDFIDFEFRLHDPVAMLPADELFSGGKLVPLHLSKPPPPSSHPAELKPSRREEIIGAVSGPDILALSPKAPTCTSRWRELLQRKRQQQQKKGSTTQKPDPVSQNQNPNPRSSALKQFLYRRSSPASDPNLNLPLLREPEFEALSRSSTSSEEISRLSLDSDMRPNTNPILLNRNPPRPRISSRSPTAGGRAGRTPARRSADTPPPPRCASVDSPKMNASGKVIFQSLGRSSSSPSTFNGGPTRNNKYRCTERSYSNNVRVINVPVPAGSIFGFLGSGSKNIGPKGKN